MLILEENLRRHLEAFASELFIYSSMDALPSRSPHHLFDRELWVLLL